MFKLFFSLLFAGFLATSCVDGSTYSDPQVGVTTYELTPTKTAKEVIALYPTSTPQLYENDDVIEGYVTSSDETGNFFNTITFQTGLSGSAPKGFSVSVELKYFNKGFVPGRKVYIKLKGLYLATVDGSLKIGTIFEGQVGRISKFEWDKHLFPSSTLVKEDELVRTLSLKDASTNDNINTLIDISNVQFTDGSLARTLYDIDSGGSATNHNIVDVNGGTNRYLRISSFSSLSSKKVPSGRGTVRGIMSKFGSDFQVLVRYYSDLKLSSAREYSFRSSFLENFNGFSAPSGNYDIEKSYISFKNYLNFTTQGTKNWFIRDNSILEMGAFFGAVEKSQCYFVVPVDMTGANTFSFKYKFSFYSAAGTVLKIYRTSDFVPGMKIADATLVDISSSFNLLSETTPNFVSTAVYNIPPAITGNGYFVLEYTGSNITAGPIVTTTVQIDDIDVK